MQNPNSKGSSQPSDLTLKHKRGMFHKDLQHIMYGYGDEESPLPETIALVEDIVIEYVTDLVHKAENKASKRGKRLTEDLLYVIRKDIPKLQRCKQLLSMNEELKHAKKLIDMGEEDKLGAKE